MESWTQSELNIKNDVFHSVSFLIFNPTSTQRHAHVTTRLHSYG